MVTIQDIEDRVTHETVECKADRPATCKISNCNKHPFKGFMAWMDEALGT